MKRSLGFIITLFLLLQGSPSALASDGRQKVADQWQKAEEEWVAAQEANSNGRIDAARLEAAAASLKPLIKIRNDDGPPWRNEQERERFAFVDWEVATVWALAGDYEKSLVFLKAQAAGSYLIRSTRNPDAFASEVFALHSQIMAELDAVIDIPDSGYKVFEVPSLSEAKKYVFVYEPEGDDERGVLISGIDQGEQRQMIQLMDADGAGNYGMGDHAQVIANRGALSISVAPRLYGGALILDGVSKVIEYKGEFGVPFVHPSPLPRIELQVREESLEQPLQALARMEAETGTGAPKGDSVRPPEAEVDPQATTPKSEQPVNASQDVPRNYGPWIAVTLAMVVGLGYYMMRVRRRRD